MTYQPDYRGLPCRGLPRDTYASVLEALWGEAEAREASREREREFDRIVSERERDGVPVDLGSLVEWDAIHGMESVAVVAAVPASPDPAVYRQGRKRVARGTVVRQSRVSERTNLTVVGVDAHGAYGRQLADGLERMADLWLRAHGDRGDLALLGSHTRSWAEASPVGLAGQLHHVAWHHDTLADSLQSATGMAWHEAEEWADAMGADAPQRRTDRDKVAWRGSHASTTRERVIDENGEPMQARDVDGVLIWRTNRKGERVPVWATRPAVLAEVGAWRDGRHYTVRCYGTTFTTWAPAGTVPTVVEHDTGCGYLAPRKRLVIVGKNGRPVRRRKRATWELVDRERGERVQLWQSAGSGAYVATTDVVRRPHVRLLVKRGRFTTDGLAWSAANASADRPAAARQIARAVAAARTYEAPTLESIRDRVAALAPGERMTLTRGTVRGSVRRLAQSDPVYRVAVGPARNQRRGIDGAAEWMAKTMGAAMA